MLNTYVKNYLENTSHYNPSSGRFVSEDPIGFKSGQTNLFNYIDNNPINYVDPLGLFSLDCFFDRAKSNFNTTASALGVNATNIIGDIVGLPIAGGIIANVVQNGGGITEAPIGGAASAVAAFGEYGNAKKTLGNIFSRALNIGGKAGISQGVRRLAVRAAMAANALSVAAGYGSLTFGIAIGSGLEAGLHSLFGTGVEGGGRGCDDECK